MSRPASSTQPPGWLRARHLAVRRRRWPLILAMTLVTVAGAVWVAGGVVLSSEPGRGVAAAGSVADEPAIRVVEVPKRRVDGWRSVLQHLDAERARAWRDGDPAALASVYMRGSDVLERDRRRLRAYVQRGFLVRGAHLRFGAITPLQHGDGVALLRVVDRLSRSSVMTSTGVERELPRDEKTRHTLRLEEQGGGWRIAAVWLR